MDEFEEAGERKSGGGRPASTLWILGGLVLLLAAGLVALEVFKPKPPPVPTALAGDPLLARGHGIYAIHCVICHGESGRGDGPNAREIKGPSPGNLTDPATWKHGRSAEQVQTVIASGVGTAAMPGWQGVLNPDGIRAVSAYVFYLARLPVPDELRKP